MKKKSLKVPIACAHVYTSERTDMFFRAGSLNLTCALCVYEKSSAGLLLELRRLSSLSCVCLTTNNFQCSSFPLPSARLLLPFALLLITCRIIQTTCENIAREKSSSSGKALRLSTNHSLTEPCVVCRPLKA